jgi:hypothetical protein
MDIMLSPTRDSYASVWQERKGEGHYLYLYMLMVVWSCHVATSTLFFIKYLILAFFLILSNYTKYICLEDSYLAMKYSQFF